VDDVLSARRALAGGIACVAVAVVAASCSSTATSNAPAAADAAVATDASSDAPFKSNCGKPGDKGNSLGVGKFCQQTIADCGENTKARLCTTLESSGADNFFCTFRCDPATDPPNVCGEEARCACSSGGCGCYPTRCDGPPSDGGATGDAGTTGDAATDAPGDAGPG
jgi:hypothetical protein